MTDLLQKKELTKKISAQEAKNKLPSETTHSQYNYSTHHGMTVANS